MGQNGARDESIELHEPFERPRVSALSCIVHVGSIFGHVDMEDGIQLAAYCARSSDGVIGDREGSMKTDEPPDEGTPVLGDKTLALGEAALGLFLATVSLCGAVTKKRSYAELVTGVRQDVE
jgi:hypothetical protein